MNLRELICVPFAWLLRTFNDWCDGHYILTLLLFAILVKILMVPMSIKQQKNQIKGAKLRPKMAIIQKKYAGKNDQESVMKMRQELMDLQQREGYSPLAGCLPMLIQLPIIMILYEIIRSPLTYICQWKPVVVAKLHNLAYPDKAPLSEAEDLAFNAIRKNVDQIDLISKINQNPEAFAEVGQDFSAIPDFTLGRVNFGVKPSFDFSTPNAWLLLIPILTFALAVVTMKLSKKFNGNLQQELAGQTADQQMSSSIMEWSMPIMSLVFGYILNGHLGVYWIYQSVISIGQMLLFHKIWPMPTFTPEEIRAYEKSLKQRPKPNTDPNRPKPRSLHHIDDDD
ncbi:MAG: YidC/Oxa1 family membrane protein insertase [Clostridia bacterium]|nr:YidC/Oxa1 family membrane protein insertase [Clostridia bacterium]